MDSFYNYIPMPVFHQQNMVSNNLKIKEIIRNRQVEGHNITPYILDQNPE